MQWLLAAVIAVAMVGGLAGYMALRGQPEAQMQRVLRGADQELRLVLESTENLGVERDPFGQVVEQAVNAVTVRVADADGVERRIEVPELEAGVERVVVLDGLVAGRNEIELEVAPVGRPVALRLVLLVDDLPRVTRVLWLEPGRRGGTTLPLELGTAVVEEGHPHDH